MSLCPPLAATPTRLPSSVALLGAAIFTVATAEFSVAGLLDTLATDLHVRLAEVGYLVSIYAGGMIVGGPLMVVALARLPQARALVLVLLLFALAQLAAAFAPGYGLLAVSRFVQGFAGSATFGLALTIGGRIAGPTRQGEAAAWIMGGLMVGTVLGLPLTTWLGRVFGWREVFVGLAVMAALAALLVASWVRPEGQAGEPARTQAGLGDARLWKVFASSFLVIGATFSAFTYFVPLLGERVGIAVTWIPACLALYGIATVVGNFVCGRWVDRHGAWRVQMWGMSVLLAALLVFAIAVEQPLPALLALVLIGLTGVALNPALVARVMALNGSPLAAAVHTGVISLGLLTGTALAGMAIEHSGDLSAALWVAALLAGLGWLSMWMAPDRQRRGGPRPPEPR